MVLGGLASYCRRFESQVYILLVELTYSSLFGELVPEGSEAAFFALYAVTDKGSSVFGPLIVGVITDMTGEIRPAFFFLAILIGLPIPIISMVNVERGRREGAALSREFVETPVQATAEPHEADNNNAQDA